MLVEVILTGQLQHLDKPFLHLANFAVLETQRSLNIGDLAGMVQKDGIAKDY